ncbi:MAG: hypothetical protein WBF43_12255 [Methylocella sp.]
MSGFPVVDVREAEIPELSGKQRKADAALAAPFPPGMTPVVASAVPPI